MNSLRVFSIMAVAVALALAIPSPAAAASSQTECGMVSSYTAPDPAGPANGSIVFGLSGPTETILADATLSAGVAANLSSITGGTPTCLAVTADDAGDITALAFASSGDVVGTVVYDPGSDAYLIADRVLAPASLIASVPGLDALVHAAADAGVVLRITYYIDEAQGFPTAFHAAHSVQGKVTFDGSGNVKIAGATIPASVVGAPSRTALQFAEATGATAQLGVTGSGTIGETLEVTIDIAVLSASCATVDARTATSITVEGVRFDLGPNGTAAASLSVGVRAGVEVALAATGTLSIRRVSLPGCAGIVDDTLPATDSIGRPSPASSQDLSTLFELAIAGLFGSVVLARRRASRGGGRAGATVRPGVRRPRARR